MGIFNMFRNPDKLSRDEKESALILSDIIYGFKICDPSYIPNGSKCYQKEYTT